MKITTREIYYLSGVIDTLPSKAQTLLLRLLEQVYEEETEEK
jgi:hypothetical protein